MCYILSNLTEGIVMAKLNSSFNIYLGPGAESGKILASEINNNSRLKRLKERGIIDIIEVEEKKAKAPRGKPKSTARTKKAKAGKSKSASGSKKKKSTKSKK